MCFGYFFNKIFSGKAYRFICFESGNLKSLYCFDFVPEKNVLVSAGSDKVAGVDIVPVELTR